MTTLKQVLEAALDLLHEEQEALVIAIQSHTSKILRTELGEYA
jgi:16S rRNA C1402 N4-methylase RsmH